MDFKQSAADPCVLIRTETSIPVVAVYVDDLVIITKTPEKIEEVKASLAARFKMKDLHYYLGITIEQGSAYGYIRGETYGLS